MSTVPDADPNVAAAGGPRPPPRVLAEIADEIEDHLASAGESHQRAGLDAAEARRRAVEQFGDPRRVAAELAWIAHGDIAMNTKVLIALVAVLAAAVVASAYLSYRSTVAVAGGMERLGEQIARLAAERPVAVEGAAPAPFGSIRIRATRDGQPVAGMEFTVDSGADSERFLKTYRTGANGVIESGPVSLGRYKITAQTSETLENGLDSGAQWTRMVGVNQPGDEPVEHFVLPGAPRYRLEVQPPEDWSIVAPLFDRIKVNLTSNRLGCNWSAALQPGQFVMVNSLPAGTYSAYVQYDFAAGQGSTGVGVGSVEFPLSGDTLTLKADLPTPLARGRIVRGGSGEGVGNVPISREVGNETVTIRSASDGRFLSPTQFLSRARIGVPGEDGYDYPMWVTLTPDAEIVIDLSKIGLLTLSLSGMSDRPTPDIALRSVELHLQLVRPFDAPSWSSDKSGRWFAIHQLGPNRRGEFEPVRTAVPSVNRAVSAWVGVSFEVITDRGRGTANTQYLLHDPPQIIGGGATQFSLTGSELCAALRDPRLSWQGENDRDAAIRCVRQWLEATSTQPSESP